MQRAVAVMNALYGAPARVRVLAADLVAHWESRSEQMRKFIGGPGKGIIVPADAEMYLRQLTAGAVEAGDITDLYEAARIPRPDLSHLDAAFIERMQQNRNPHLAIEALRRLIEQEMRRVTRHNVVRQQSFSDRLVALMARYTNQSLSAGQVIAELVAMAREVSADANAASSSLPP